MLYRVAQSYLKYASYGENKKDQLISPMTMENTPFHRSPSSEKRLLIEGSPHFVDHQKRAAIQWDIINMIVIHERNRSFTQI
jgi:hypothetical protein